MLLFEADEVFIFDWLKIPTIVYFDLFFKFVIGLFGGGVLNLFLPVRLFSLYIDVFYATI